MYCVAELLSWLTDKSSEYWYQGWLHACQLNQYLTNYPVKCSLSL